VYVPIFHFNTDIHPAQHERVVILRPPQLANDFLVSLRKRLLDRIEHDGWDVSRSIAGIAIIEHGIFQSCRWIAHNLPQWSIIAPLVIGALWTSNRAAHCCSFRCRQYRYSSTRPMQKEPITQRRSQVNCSQSRSQRIIGEPGRRSSYNPCSGTTTRSAHRRGRHPHTRR
jgi:hypothetical protein